MKYVLAACLALLVFLAFQLFSGETTARPRAEEKAPPDDERPVIADYDPATRVPVAVQPTVPPEPLSPLETFLAANPDSPLKLLAADEAAKYLATRENFVAWNSTVDEYAHIDLEAIDYNEELAYLWQLCKEHQALRTFCMGYLSRELERWRAGASSVALEDELQPALSFIGAQFGDDAAVWDAVNAFSSDAIEQIRGEGEETDRLTNPRSRGRLNQSLVENGAAPFYAVRDVILKGPKR